MRKVTGEYNRTHARVRRENQASSGVLLENMTSEFGPKTVGPVKVMAYAFQAEMPTSKWRLPHGEFTRGSPWTERKIDWVGRSERSRNDFIGDLRL